MRLPICGVRFEMRFEVLFIDDVCFVDYSGRTRVFIIMVFVIVVFDVYWQ